MNRMPQSFVIAILALWHRDAEDGFSNADMWISVGYPRSILKVGLTLGIWVKLLNSLDRAYISYKDAS